MGYIANQKDLLITGTTLTAATIIAIGARFWARRRLRAKLGPDDWCALVAGLIFVAQNIAMWWGVVNSYYGIDPMTMGPDQLKISLKMTFAGIFLMSAILTLCRLSVIFLYNRLFGVYATFQKILIVYGVISLMWPLVIWFAAIFRCRPVKGSWDLTTNPRCAFDLQTLFVITESINAVLDIFLVLLPISKIKNLQLPLREKVGLGFIFLLGGFVGLTSLLRIVFTYNPTKKGAVIDSVFWLWLQLAMAIICACLPTLRSLLPGKQFFSPVTTTLRRLLRSHEHSSTTGPSRLVETRKATKRSDRSLYAGHHISGKSDDEIALTGISIDIRSTT